MFYIGSRVMYVSSSGHQMWGRVEGLVGSEACHVRAGYTPGSVALSEYVDCCRLALDPAMPETNAAAAAGERPR